ncbi:MAG: glycosyltransferase, partial [Pacificimonas sp.]
MRVVYDEQIFAMQRYGGISRYFARIAEELAVHPEIETEIVAPLHINAYLDDCKTANVRGLALKPSRFSRRAARIAGQLLAGPASAILKPDIVHETYYRSGPRKARSCPTVLTVYDMIHELFPESFPESDMTMARKRDAVLNADHVICISENTKRDLTRLIPEATLKTSVVLLGFDPPRGTITDERPHSKPYLLYVGDRGGYKNFALLIEAVAEDPGLADLDIGCFGGGLLGSDVIALIRKHGV